MAYTEDLTWSDLVGSAEFFATSVKDGLVNGADGRLEWQNWKATFRGGGLTNSDIATELSVTEAAIDDMDALYDALFELYQCANNIATAQANRFEAIRKFT